LIIVYIYINTGDNNVCIQFICNMALVLDCRQYKPFQRLHATGWMHWSSWSISTIRFNPPVYLVYGWTIINRKACISQHSGIQFPSNRSCVVGACGRRLPWGAYQCVQMKSCAQRVGILKGQTAVYYMIFRSSLHEYKYCTVSIKSVRAVSMYWSVHRTINEHSLFTSLPVD
jgi:hypothetical protein